MLFISLSVSDFLMICLYGFVFLVTKDRFKERLGRSFKVVCSNSSVKDSVSFSDVLVGSLSIFGILWDVITDHSLSRCTKENCRLEPNGDLVSDGISTVVSRENRHRYSSSAAILNFSVILSGFAYLLD